MSDHESARSGWSFPLSRVRLWLPGAAAVVAVALLALSIYGPTNANADPETYRVSLVSDTATAEATTTTPQTNAGTVADVAAEANASVVTVYTFVSAQGPNNGIKEVRPGENPGSTDGQTPLGAGSGWTYSADGYVVTNAHVVEGADSFVIQYYDGTQVEAELVGKDTFQDVAVLKLQLGDGEEVPGVAKVGDSTAMRAGDPVVAIGSPLGEFTNSVSDGIIGGLDRSLDDGNGASLDNLIQHDAEISPGNSGGPLLNMQGEVIGMNVAKVETTASNGATASGLNFAIDGNTVVGIVDEIISTNGSIAHPYLGVQLQMTEQGQVVVAVEPGSPAADGGIQEGDVLVGVDGTSVDQETSFMDLLLQHNPGDTVSVTVQRGGQEQELSVTLGTRPDGL
jgi:2-alkenal reductase